MTNKFSIILAASILLNVFLLGFALSTALRNDVDGHEPDMRPPFSMNDKHDMGHDHFGPPPEPPENMMSRLFEENAENLPDHERVQVLAIIKKYRNDTGSDFEKFAPIFESLQKEFVADKFDEKKVSALHHQLDELDLKNKQKMGDMMVEIAKKMSPQNRKTFFMDIMPSPHGPDEKK